MKRMWKKLVVLVGCLSLFLGCATANVISLGHEGLADGSSVEYKVPEKKGAWGQDVVGLDGFHTQSVYDERTKRFRTVSTLIRQGTGISDAYGKQLAIKVPTALVQGASQGVFWWWAAKVLRPDTTNVNTNVKQTGGVVSATGGAATATGGAATATGGNGGAGGNGGNGGGKDKGDKGDNGIGNGGIPGNGGQNNPNK